MLSVFAIKKELYLRILLVFLPLAISSAAIGAEKNGVKRCPIIDMVDELEYLKIFPGKKTINRIADTLSTPQDLMYECYIASIGNHSPIDFDYNAHVRRYIDIYTIERRDQVAQMLGLAEMYFPLFDEYLDKYQLPLELKYLAVVESALNPMAVSKTGAVGLWQFKINTGRMFNLDVTSYVDDRMDPEKATEAACLYLQYLYRIFNNWQLALAAYNVGPGAINNAIARSGGETSFWKIYDNLPESAQNYVPAFIAAAYVMKNYASHNIKKESPLIAFSQTDTVMAIKPVNFTTLSKAIGVPIEIIRFLNPTYKLDFIPENSAPVTLRLPADKTSLFISNENAIYKNSTKPTAIQLRGVSDSSAVKQKVIYTVKSGDSMHRIAIIYGCTVEDIQSWNPSIDSTLSVGEPITVWVSRRQFEKMNHQN